ncbi:chorismate-binding protein [bacterium]|nr:chorismate-binding protein [bacterium]
MSLSIPVVNQKKVDLKKPKEKVITGFWGSPDSNNFLNFSGTAKYFETKNKNEFYEWLDTVPSTNNETFVLIPFSDRIQPYIGFVPESIVTTKNSNLIPPSFNKKLPKCLSRLETLNREDWIKHVNDVKHLIVEGKVSKVVLARKISLVLDQKVELRSLLSSFLKSDSYKIGIEYDDLSFLSVSPELLFKKKDDVIQSHAIAGTRSRGESDIADLTFEKDLKGSKKECEEHKFVLDAVSASLEQICNKVSLENSFEILKQAKVQHLKSTLEGRLNTDQSLSKIISSLFPTPAVAGMPKTKSLGLIEELEKEDRGYYSGLIGKVCGNSAEFVVNIRTAFLKKNLIELWAGAGIVADSNGDEEWNELEQKVQHYLDLFL